MRRGLSLVEALIASVVFLSMAVLIAGFMLQGRRTLTYSANRLRAASLARAALERALQADRRGQRPEAGVIPAPPTPEEAGDRFWTAEGGGAQREVEVTFLGEGTRVRRLVARVKWREAGKERLEEVATLRISTLSTSF
jgi:Tfp pilus assembly protein PilV